MAKEIFISGIYDFETIVQLREISLKNFGFDFRPRSFSFLQQHHLVEILKKCHQVSDRYFFHFDQEKDYIIFKFIDHIKEKIPFCKNFSLKFSDNMNPEFYEKFAHPFLWYYQSKNIFKEILFLSHLQGIILPYSFLFNLHEKGTLKNFIFDFSNELKKNKKKTELVLSLEWKDNFSPFIFDLFDFDMISFTINKDVEFSYRSVNINLIKKELSYRSNLLKRPSEKTHYNFI